MYRREAYCAVIERQNPNMADMLWHPAEIHQAGDSKTQWAKYWQRRKQQRQTGMAETA